MLGGAVEALEQGVNSLHVAAQELERALRETEFDPHALERSEERLFALRAAARKFSVPVDDLPALAVKFADALSTIDAGEERLAALAKQAQALRSGIPAACRKLVAQAAGGGRSADRLRRAGTARAET